MDRVLLSVALLRVASIPARGVVGFFDNGDGVLSAAEMRIWTEFLGDDGWQMIENCTDDVWIGNADRIP